MTETKKPSKADMLIYKALNRAIENDRLRIYLIMAKSTGRDRRFMTLGNACCRYWCRCWSACC